jgi:DNA-binding NarL/FixJ family response regulator
LPEVATPLKKNGTMRAAVKTHVNRIFAKTGSRDRAQAIRHAYTHGYAEPV